MYFFYLKNYMIRSDQGSLKTVGKKSVSIYLFSDSFNYPLNL